MRKSDGLTINGRIEATAHDVNDLRREVKAWPFLDESERHELLRSHSAEPAERVTTSNIALNGFLNHLARTIDR